VLTIGALFMIAAGMYSTGAISILSEKLIGRPKSIFQAQLKILPNIAFGSAFLNNTPLVAMMIPVIRDLSKSCGLDAKKLYLPLSYASILAVLYPYWNSHQPGHKRYDQRKAGKRRKRPSSYGTHWHVRLVLDRCAGHHYRHCVYNAHRQMAPASKKERIARKHRYA